MVWHVCRVWHVWPHKHPIGTLQNAATPPATFVAGFSLAFLKPARMLETTHHHTMSLPSLANN